VKTGVLPFPAVDAAIWSAGTGVMIRSVEDPATSLRVSLHHGTGNMISRMMVATNRSYRGEYLVFMMFLLLIISVNYRK
jgi:hypothetical protein